MSFQAPVKILRSLPELEEIRPEWESWPGHRDSHIDFFSEVVRSSPSTVRPHVIVLYKEGKPDAALIGRIDLTRLHLTIGHWRVPAPQVRLLTFAMGASRGNSSSNTCELLLREALNSLRCREADVARVDFIAEDSVLHQLSKQLPGLVGRDYGTVLSPHWIMDLPRTYPEIMQSFSGDYRNQLKRKGKKIQSKFPTLSFRCFERPEELDEMVRDVEIVAGKSYQRGMQVGFYDNPATRKSLASQMASCRYLGYALYLEDKIAAYWLGSFFDHVFYSDYLAFDPEFSEHSPGTYLQMRVLEDLVTRQATRIDFGPGDARYKAQLGTTCRQEVTLHLFPSTLNGATLNLLRTLTTLGNRSAKALVGGLGLGPQIRKVLRGVKTPVINVDSPSSPNSSGGFNQVRNR